MIVNVNLMVESVILIKSGIMINVDASVENIYDQSFPYENHCESYKKLASRPWPVLFALTYFFLYMHFPLLLQNN